MSILSYVKSNPAMQCNKRVIEWRAETMLSCRKCLKVSKSPPVNNVYDWLPQSIKLSIWFKISELIKSMHRACLIMTSCALKLCHWSVSEMGVSHSQQYSSNILLFETLEIGLTRVGNRTRCFNADIIGDVICNDIKVGNERVYHCQSRINNVRVSKVLCTEKTSFSLQVQKTITDNWQSRYPAINILTV